MRLFGIPLALLSVSLAQAAPATPPLDAYADFTTSSGFYLAGTIAAISSTDIQGSTTSAAIGQAKLMCSAISDCIFTQAIDRGSGTFTIQLGRAATSGVNYDALSQPTSVSWRYNANLGTGPTCSSITDTFSMNGQCNCGATETQSSSNFGCLTAQGSPVTRRRQLQMDGRKAGIAPQPYFKALRSAASPKRQVIVHPGKDMGILPSVEDLATIQTAASRK